MASAKALKAATLFAVVVCAIVVTSSSTEPDHYTGPPSPPPPPPAAAAVITHDPNCRDKCAPPCATVAEATCRRAGNEDPAVKRICVDRAYEGCVHSCFDQCTAGCVKP